MAIQTVEPVQTFVTINGVRPERTNIYKAVSNTADEDPLFVWGVVNAYIKTGSLLTPDYNFKGSWAWQQISDTKSYMISADARLEDPEADRFVWIVTFVFVNYKQRDVDQDSPITDMTPQPAAAAALAAGTPAPLTVDANDVRWRGSFFPVERLETLDSDGQPLINSAEQPYDAQVIERNWPTIIVDFFTPTLALAARCGWVNKINSGTFWGFTLNQLQLARWEYRLLYDTDNVPYIFNTAEIWVNVDEWKCELPNYGTVELNNQFPTTQPDGRYEPILFKDDIPGTNLMLDAGGKIAADQLMALTNPYTFHKPLDFSTTPLPANLPAALGGA